MSTTEEMLSILEDTTMLLRKAQINLMKSPKTRHTVGHYEARLKSIEEYWTTFKTVHQDLIRVTKKEERSSMSYFLNEEFFAAEDLYLCLHGDLKDLILNVTTTKMSNQSTSSSSTETSMVKLPRIQLPTFNGNYDEWPTFHDLFVSLVHENKTISDVQKLHYLKSSVVGEAEALLRHVQIMEKNYTQAWEILKTRYGNKRLIVNSVLKRLFNQKKMITQSSNQLKGLLDTTPECMNNLQNQNVSTDSWDPIIIFLVVQKLDPESHKQWEEWIYKENSQDLPLWEDLKRFLEAKFRTLEMTTKVSQNRPSTSKETCHVVTSRATNKLCQMCKENHTISHCKEFIKLEPNERSDYVKNNNLGFNCLVPGHSAAKCQLTMSCRICKRRHHSLLHQSTKTSDATAQQAKQPQPTALTHASVEEQEDVQINTMIASHLITKQQVALLATAMVTVRSEQGHTIVLRALVDQGSQASFISEKAAQMLKLTRQPAKGNVVGVGSTRTSVNHVVQIQIRSRCKSNYNLPVQAYVMSKQLTTKIPTKAIVATNWPHLENLNLADPSYFTPGQIDLLLGVKEYAQIIQPEQIKGPPGTPCAQKTFLGWILFGEINTKQQEDTFLVMHHQVDVEDMLKSIWEIETDSKRKLTKEEELCEDIYKKTHTRNEDGRYIVKLPFKTNNPKSPDGNTKEIAMTRLLHLERKFKKLPKFKEEYEKVIDQYIELEHMEEVPEIERNTKKAVYLPHHAVVREDKETSKTRVVFDPSCKAGGTNNVSLNEELLVGPQLQDDIRNLIMRWRMKRICFVADIQMMYRQILVTKDDADFQRILWRKDVAEDVKEYRLLRVTFGIASAPYLAVKTLQQVAKDEGVNKEKATQAIINDFYMDDLMSGSDTVSETIGTAKDIRDILQKGGFELAKWSSNNIEFMRFIEPEDRSSKASLDLNVDGTIKALGVVWNLGEDQFQYSLNLASPPEKITKRTILSDIQKLFDPLGWIAPSTVMAKILIQKLWLEKTDWDEKVSLNLEKEWLNIRSDFENVNDIRMPRWLNTVSTNKRVQIHGFSDASQNAYAAAVYIRVEQSDGTVDTKLIAARTRVAPLKTISLPRLELCGALLLSKLMKQIGQAMRIPTSQMFAWTDSSIVIAWLFGDPHRWTTFVANRVVEIMENINSNQYFHVQSQDNPADIASRGMMLSDLKKHDIWWRGPKWLTEKNIKFTRPEIVQTDTELKKNKIQVNLKIRESDTEDMKITSAFENFDNLSELVKTIAYCRRFLNFKKKSDEINNDDPLTTQELAHSLTKCIKMVQREEFHEEIERLKEKKEVKKKSALKSFNPYLDEFDILRVGGRLRHANLDDHQKHPIILGNKNQLTPLIIAEAHKQTLHGGVQLMLCYLKSKYWIMRAKGLVKKHIHKCLRCARQNATTRTQIMGDLPRVRVTPSRPFLNSGVDFAGPFQVLISKGRGARTKKAYIAIFICMAVKAIHLELVGDLTAEAFIGAFRRFVARRGKCSHLWSDQGRHFVGANKDLVAAWKQAQLEFTGQIAETLASEGTQWHFIPAYSPHFGGLWEAGVKSIKHHLKRILTTNLTFEEMNTVLCQVEACLNSRPLCPVDNTDTDNIEPLTPGHFLIGEAPIVVPSPNLSTIKTHHLSRWQFTQKLLGDFWQRWQDEYLSRLQQRPKWLKNKKEFELGDIVLIETENLPPAKWLLGRITDKHPGYDGITRVYSVKSGDSVTKRPVTKLCYLPVDTSD